MVDMHMPAKVGSKGPESRGEDVVIGSQSRSRMASSKAPHIYIDSGMHSPMDTNFAMVLGLSIRGRR